MQYFLCLEQGSTNQEIQIKPNMRWKKNFDYGVKDLKMNVVFKTLLHQTESFYQNGIQTFDY